MSLEALGLIVIFMLGVLFDHFVLNKLAGVVTADEAAFAARLHVLEQVLGPMHAVAGTALLAPQAATAPASPAPAAAPAASVV